MREPLKIPRSFTVLTDSGRASLLQTLDELENGFKVEIKPIRRDGGSTDKQKRTYYWWLGILSDSCGHEVRRLDRFMRARFLPVRDEEILGVRSRALTDLDELSTAEMSAFCERMRALAAEYGCVLPDPVPREARR